MNFEAGFQGAVERTTDTAASTSAASGQDGAGGGTNNAYLKRECKVPANAKLKQKKAKCKRTAKLGYTVQEGEDMLLVISKNYYQNYNLCPKKKGSRKKTGTKGKSKVFQSKKKKTDAAKSKRIKIPLLKKKILHKKEGMGHRWGEDLPEELLVNIFEMVVIQDGAVPFLCRVARVCRLWNAAASCAALWRSVTMRYCWTEPGKTQLPKAEQKIKNTLNWLAQNKFSQLREFSLCHWKKNVDYAVEVVSLSCPHLRSLKLSYCTGVTEKTFRSLGVNSQCLESINVQYSEVEGLVSFLESCGRKIQQILFTHGSGNDRLLAAISKGCCPNLDLLEVNTKLDSAYGQLHLCIQGLQNGCPKLKGPISASGANPEMTETLSFLFQKDNSGKVTMTFRMLNVTPIHKMMPNGPDPPSGFPLLEELCMATTSVSFMTDKNLRDILCSSTKLKVLDLRGCSRVTPFGLADLPCAELECLFWGQYFNSRVAFSLPKKGLHILTEKWSETLKELDITNHLFTEDDFEMAMGHLAQATNTDALRSLNLTGTRITSPALRMVIGRSTGLGYLNLSSCRNLPRGLKRTFRGQDDIHQLLNNLE